MEGSSFSHAPVGSGATAALSVHKAKKFFEFFKAGTHREVLLLGEPKEQAVHWVKSKGHKVLCVARVRPCELCAVAGTSADVAEQQIEFYVPTYVRRWKEREYHQRVSVFAFGATEKIMALLDEKNAGVARGQRLNVKRFSNGTSDWSNLELMPGLPSGFPVQLPVEFDVLPFIRARYGMPQTADRPIVLLPSFRCDASMNGTGGTIRRPKPLDLSATDCPQLTDEVREKIKGYAARLGVGSTPVEPPVDPLEHFPAPVPPAEPKEPAERRERMPSRRESALPAGDVLQDVFNRRGIAVPETTAADEDLALTKGTGEIICDEMQARLPADHPARNGKHPAPSANGKHHLNGKKGGGH